MRLSTLAGLLPTLPALVWAAASTDTLQDADAPQSGYLPNHNMDPAKLSSYVIPWSATFNANELLQAKPLVFTPSGTTSELVILVSNQNMIRVYDGPSGTLLNTRTLDPPFQATDASCGDIVGTIGITSTPIIDPVTEIMYFTSKGYKGGATGSGTINGQYKMYAVKVPSLQDVDGWPIILEGNNANNDRARYFIGGTLLQRPGIASVGDNILLGFGGHCDNFNYTGYLMAVSKTTKSVTNMQAMVAAPGAPSPQPTDIMVQNGGKAAIWQSGMALAVDQPNKRVYFVTGNARGAGANANNVAASGKVPISTLEQCAARFDVSDNGNLTQRDYFEPTNYNDLNGGDRDFGSSGIALLDPVFSGGGVNRIAVAPGKSGTVYIMDADNLGGFMMGAGGSDGTLQQLSFPTVSFFSGVASYPLEGGYIYFCPTGDVLYAYKFGLDGNGKPLFTLAGKSSQTFAGHGVPVITTNNGQAGTGVVWMADVNMGLVAYNAIPVNGVLQPITMPLTGRLQKNQRPVFGNGRLYMIANNKIWAMAVAGTSPPQSTVKISTTKPTVISTTTSKTSTTSKTTSTTSSTSSKPTTTTSTTTSPISSTSSSTTSSQTTSTSSVSSTSSSTTTSKSTSTTSTTSTGQTTSTGLTTLTTSTKTTGSSSTSTIASPTSTQTIPKGKVITLNWNVGWVWASPDGFGRPFVGINGQWPPAPISATLGDTLKINVVNGLVNQTTAIHFHGLFQRNTTFSDGPAMVNQCPIPPGETFVYQFRLLQTGTYWYHAHVGGQYIDGLRAALIIKDPYTPYKSDYDVTLTLTDLYHQQAPYLINYFQSQANTDQNGGVEPVPQTNLINEAKDVQFPIVAGKTYMFRIINMGAMAGQYLQFDQHNMTIIEVDGVTTQPFVTSQLFVAVAQRYTVLVKAKTDKSQNFAIVAKMNSVMFADAVTPTSQILTTTGWLVYDSTKALPAPFSLSPQPWDDTQLVPYDQESLYDPPTQTIYLTVSFGTDDDSGATRGMFNGQTFLFQKVPTLYTAMYAPHNVVTDPTIYGSTSNPFVLPFGAVVEVNINNHDDRAHPFHLHGHAFQVINRADGGALFPGLFNTPAVPMKRDTLVVYGESSATIRFRADNPGINLFHCHTEWHVESGLTATFIEAPDVLQDLDLYLPASHRTVCDKQGIARTGNAAGNKKNWQDLTGMNTAVPTANWGAMVTPPPAQQ